jgi:hypothetical protein
VRWRRWASADNGAVMVCSAVRTIEFCPERVPAGPLVVSAG